MHIARSTPYCRGRSVEGAPLPELVVPSLIALHGVGESVGIATVLTTRVA
jgi:hypothetical protein